MIETRHYRDALMAVAGASRLDSLNNVLYEQVKDIAADSGVVDLPFMITVSELKIRCVMVFEETDSTLAIKRDNEVRRLTAVLAHMAYHPDLASQVSGHPVVRLMVDQMRTIAGLPQPIDDPEFGYLWNKAHTTCQRAIEEEK